MSLKDLNVKLEELAREKKTPIVCVIADIDDSIVLKLAPLLNGKTYDELILILQTHGGDANAAFTLVRLLRRHAASLKVYVPLFAKSAGTLICLGANELILTEIAELGPLDAQISERRDGEGRSYRSALNGFSAMRLLQSHALENLDLAAKLLVERSGLKLSEALRLAIEYAGDISAPMHSKIDPKEIGEYDRALRVGYHYGLLILVKFMGWPVDKASTSVQRLVYDYPSHGFVVDKEELCDLGLPAACADATENKTLLDIGDLGKRASALEGGIVHLVETIT